MFDPKTSKTERLADAVDLVIDFATLGEYGLEPSSPAPRPCETRHRPRRTRSTGAWDAAIERFKA
jgi:hypothetical protein